MNGKGSDENKVEEMAKERWPVVMSQDQVI
jgi:hypothetical protein